MTNRSEGSRCRPDLPATHAGHGDGPVFNAQWEAQAFAMKVALQERGLITPAEWADAMGAAIRAAQACGDPDTGETYYRHWLVALEELLARNGLVDRVTRLRYQDAWERAAHRTPHGEAIELSPGDFAG